MKFRTMKLVAAIACVALVAAGAVDAAKLKIKNLPVDVFQGIDENGDLDGGNFEGLIKLSINLNTGKATVSGKASVDNEFGKKVTFKDEDFAGIGDLITDKYTVSKAGKATYKGKYENVTL